MKFFQRRPKCIICGICKSEDNMHIKYKGIGVCKKCYDEALHTTKDKCFDGKGAIKFVMSAFMYIGDIKKTVKLYKFSGQKFYGVLFGKLICQELADIDIFTCYDMIVPVPLHGKRLDERGFNQSEVIAEVLAEYLNLPINTDVLIRTRETRRQSSLKGMERAENVKGAFYADRINVSGKNIILVDDIYTMGETVKACAEALKEAGAVDIIAVTLCKTDEKTLERLWR